MFEVKSIGFSKILILKILVKSLYFGKSIDFSKILIL